MSKFPQKDQAMPTGEQAPSLILAIIVGFSSCIVAAIMAFGNPTMWITGEQQRADRYAVGVEKEDWAFIDSIAGNGYTSEDFICFGSYQAISQSEDSRRETNIALAAESIHGYELKPGEMLSVNEIFGDTNKDPRYVDALVMNEGTLGNARGGGICQVSTALYIAAIKANLEIIERHPHSMVCDYAPVGLDATLVYGQKDLRIKNNHNASVWIYAVALGQTVEVKLFSAADVEAGYSYDATSKIVKQKVETVKPEEGSSEESTERISAYTAESYKVVYKDGVKQSAQLLYRDTYQVSDQSTVMIAEGGVDPSK